MSHSIKLKFLGDFEDFPSAKGRGGEGQSQLFPFAVNDSDHRHHRNQITQEILLSKEDLDVCLPDSALPVNGSMVKLVVRRRESRIRSTTAAGGMAAYVEVVA